MASFTRKTTAILTYTVCDHHSITNTKLVTCLHTYMHLILSTSPDWIFVLMAHNNIHIGLKSINTLTTSPGPNIYAATNRVRGGGRNDEDNAQNQESLKGNTGNLASQ